MQTYRRPPNSGASHDLLQEALSLVEGDVKSWLHASEHCQRLARGRTVQEKAELNLLRAVFRERSKLHKVLVKRIVQRTASDTRIPIAIDSTRRSPLSFAASTRTS